MMLPERTYLTLPGTNEAKAPENRSSPCKKSSLRTSNHEFSGAFAISYREKLIYQAYMGMAMGAMTQNIGKWM